MISCATNTNNRSRATSNLDPVPRASFLNVSQPWPLLRTLRSLNLLNQMPRLIPLARSFSLCSLKCLTPTCSAHSGRLPHGISQLLKPLGRPTSCPNAACCSNSFSRDHAPFINILILASSVRDGKLKEQLCWRPPYTRKVPPFRRGAIPSI